ncbi:MAG: choice-of-anchor B family protein [Saprospiraceae bacterium]|nr:choice-of-anchor B family protein [Saprospiraceae bacterium]
MSSHKPALLALVAIIFCLAERSQGQIDYNLVLLANPENNCLNGFNDVWGLEHSNGTEYAVVGTRCGTSIYDLANPEMPVLVADVPGAPGVWRDMKNWGDKIYVVADQGSMGIQVIDLADTSEVRSWNFNPVSGSDTLKKAHNLFIDAQGLMYVAGSHLNAGGVVIFNINADDSIPPISGFGPPEYAHDVVVNEAREIMLTSDIYVGNFSVHTLDRNDLMNIGVTTEASQETGSSFTHNAWTTDDGNIAFVTDEVPGAFVEAYDISDLDDIIFLDKYAPFSTLGSNVTPHNVHVKGNHLIISFYRDGVKIVDISRPANLVEVGGYDTQPGNGSGCWGAFPFLHSDLVLATDISTGFFVLQPNYSVQACHLEGLVMDELGNMIDSAYIQVLTYDSVHEYSGSSGNYATGIVDQTTLPENPGRSASNTVRVLVSKKGYESKDTMITFLPGMVVNQDFVLQEASLPVELISFSVGEKDCNNQLLWRVGSEINHSHFEVESSSDGIFFNPEASIFPPAIAGDSYEYLDAQIDRKNYYRLKQVDLDGTVDYSPVIFIENKCVGSGERLLIYPNPVQSYLNLETDLEIKTLVISDNSGKTIMDFPGDVSNNIDISHLAPGLYYLRIIAKNMTRVDKIFKTQ